ncbi:flagellar hook-basal body protein [Flavisphingomonas formosensis]|uniref:flagellar hook-basal body protein n=1 Tax=Flavisphingomonas formosensis TaxID=861534 RepID=UPI0012FAF6D7|nr:flagellar hook-basal body protein [Sphingomonas formosensis]
MNGAFYIGATGLDAQQRALDTIANNIANINTPAFKRSAARFADLMATPRDRDDLPVTLSDRTGTLQGVTVQATPHVWTQGELRQTGNAMDLAIDGEGFVELMGPSGQMLLWRGGTLKVNGDGYLATADGTPLRAMIAVPAGATDLSISRDGVLSATVDGETGAREIGRIDLVTVRDSDQLIDRGAGTYEIAEDDQAQSAEPGSEGAGVFRQGVLEQANVSLSDEMVTLLLLQRAYAANAQVVQAGDQLMALVNGLRR